MPRDRTLIFGGMLAVALVALPLLWACRQQDEQARQQPSYPNIVLISVDTLRPDHLGCYGYERRTSPRIDQLAKEGALFENVISSTSWTLPAHCALFTGLADSVHGCISMDRQLDDNRNTLAECLRALGYTTVGFFSGPSLHPAFGISQGFDKYVDCTSFAELTLEALQDGRGLQARAIRDAAHADITNPRVHQEVRTWLTEELCQPFFMFVHMWDVHFDYIPPPPYDRMFDPDYAGPITGEQFIVNPAVNRDMPRRDLEHIIALYDGEIAWTDDHVGKILDDLDALNLRDSTIVVLLADHGEEFFEHGSKAHRQTLYDEVIRVPLIVRHPGHIQPGRRVTAQARMIDLLPTLLEMVGAPRPTDIMGQSLAPLFSGGTLQAEDALAVSELYSFGRRLRSFRRLHCKVIQDLGTRRLEPYDLLADPGEHGPLSLGMGELAKQLQRDARDGNAWLSKHHSAHPFRPSLPTLSESLRQQLESLGYIGSDHQAEADGAP